MKPNLKKILFLIISIILILIFAMLFFYGQEENENINIAIKETKNNEKTEVEYGIINGGYEGFYIYNLKSNEIIKNIKTGNYVNKIELHDNYIYLVDNEGFKIYAILDNYEVQMVNSFNTYGESLSLVKNGDYIYLADGNNGIVIFELDKDIYIRFLHHIRINGIVIEIVKKDNFVFALGPRFGLKVYEVVDSNLKEVTSFSSLISPSKIYIKDDTLFIKDDILGLYAFDTNDIIENHKFQPLYNFKHEIGDLAPITKNLFYYTNSEGLNKYDEGELKLIYSEDLLRSNINFQNEKIYISKKEKGIEIFDLKTEEVVYNYNILSYVNSFNIYKNGIFIEDSGKIYFFDHDYNLKWSRDIKGNIAKTSEGMVAYEDNSVTVVSEDFIKTKIFEKDVRKTIIENENILVLLDDKITSFDEEREILKGFYTDFLSYKDNFFVSDKNNLYKLNPLTKNLEKLYYSSNEIKSIEVNEKYFFVMTDYGIHFLDKDFTPIRFFPYSHFPDNYIFENDNFYMTFQNTVIILNTNIDALFSEYKFDIPIVDIDVYDGIVYLSHSSYGIEWFKVKDNMELELIGEFTIFNANNFYL
jgi:uncharacterized protein YxeA